MTPMTISFQVLPGGLVEREAIYETIRAALAVVKQSGLSYTVNSMETTLEGDYDTVMAVIKEAQNAVVAAGAARVFTLIKVDYSPHESGLCKLTYD